MPALFYWLCSALSSLGRPWGFWVSRFPCPCVTARVALVAHVRVALVPLVGHVALVGRVALVGLCLLPYVALVTALVALCCPRRRCPRAARGVHRRHSFRRAALREKAASQMVFILGF